MNNILLLLFNDLRSHRINGVSFVMIELYTTVSKWSEYINENVCIYCELYKLHYFIVNINVYKYFD